ncbi:MAG: ComF family protein [Pseudomonadota bacterium]
MLGFTRLRNSASIAGKVALDLVLPPLCLSCHEPVTQNGVLCAACWESVAFLAPPWCEICGFPFDYDQGDQAICGDCAASPPPFDQCRSVMRYGDVSKSMIMAFKHADRIDVTKAFGGWLGRIGGAMTEQADLIVPVPLHWRRLLSRRYNQAALLAQVLSRQFSVSYGPDYLIRKKATVSQGRLSAAARHRNVQGAFFIPDKHRSKIAGRKVLLVDDVMTTGATVHACTNTLLRAGAARVQVLVLARVFRGQG